MSNIEDIKYGQMVRGYTYRATFFKVDDRLFINIVSFEDGNDAIDLARLAFSKNHPRRQGFSLIAIERGYEVFVEAPIIDTYDPLR